VVRHHRNRWRLLKKHDKIRHVYLVITALAVRHTLEYATLKVIGSVLYSDPDIRKDKLQGRRYLLTQSIADEC
jgi:hypothetical protein